MAFPPIESKLLRGDLGGIGILAVRQCDGEGSEFDLLDRLRVGEDLHSVYDMIFVSGCLRPDVAQGIGSFSAGAGPLCLAGSDEADGAVWPFASETRTANRVCRSLAAPWVKATVAPWIGSWAWEA